MDDPQLKNSAFFSSNPNRPSDSACTWANLVLGSDTLPIAQSFRVSKVEYCKCTGGKDHEFIKLFFCNDDCKASILVDRAMVRESPGTARAGSHSSLPSVPGTPTGSSHNVTTKSIQLPSADDRVFITVDGSEASTHSAAQLRIGAYSVVCTLEPSTEINSMDASRVAILIRTISELRPQYNALGNQCYWFADSVFQTIMAITKCEEKHGVDSDMRGKLYMLPFGKSGQKLGQESAEANDGETVENRSNSRWKPFSYSSHKLGKSSQKSGQESPEVNDGETVEDRSNYFLKSCAISPHKEPDSNAVLKAYNQAVEVEKEKWQKKAKELEKAKRNEEKANLFDEEKKKAERAERAAAAAEKIAADERAVAAAAKQTAAAAKQNEEIAKQKAEEERLKAEGAKQNEEIAKQKAEGATKYAAELEEKLRALQVQFGVQENV